MRDIPDVSFFSGDGSLNSASLICVSAIGACTYSATAENTAQEVGGTSVATPQMAGVMALINQKSGAAQGLANPGLYQLAARQNYASCSAETVKSNSASCYFNDVDTGTIAMPCDLGAPEGGATYNNGWSLFNPFAGIVSPNCAAINSVDAGAIGTLVSSGSTPGYNASVGYDLATGLGSLNVANIVNAWQSDAGTGADTLTVTPTPTSISANQSINVVITVAGSGSLGTPTGTVVLSGGGYSAAQQLDPSTGTATIVVPGNSLVTGSDLMTVTYSGNANYASATKTFTETVAVIAPTVTVSAPLSGNVANAIPVTVTVTGPVGSPTPTGTLFLASGSYNSGSVTLTSSGTASINIPANSLAVGSDTLTATYSGSSTFAGAAGTASILMVSTALAAPTVTITPLPTSIDSSQSLSVTVAVSGSAGTPTGTVTLTAGTYSGAATALTGSGLASFTVPGNSLSAGTATLTANYSGDANYSAKSGTGSETVTQSVFALTAGTPSSSSVTPGTTATVTISGSTSATFYSGTVTLNSCSLTTSPTGANTSALPYCSITGTISYTNGVPTGSATATVSTTATIASLTYPRLPTGQGNDREMLGAGGSFVLAFLVFLGVPARRRAWRAMLGMLVLIAALGTLSACGGGGSSSGSTSIPGTSAGTYTFTVSGTASTAVTPAPTTTFTINVN